MVAYAATVVRGPWLCLEPFQAKGCYFVCACARVAGDVQTVIDEQVG